MRVLIVDLNNFAMYPTVAVGYLVSILRQAGVEVEVFSPLASGVTGVVREPPVKPWGLLDQRLRYWSAVSSNPVVKSVRAKLAHLHGPKLARHTDQVFRDFERNLNAGSKFDAVLISTYLLYHDLCGQMCRACKQAGVPAIIGGAYFAEPKVAQHWIGMEGLTALATGEVEPQLTRIVREAASGTLQSSPGVLVPESAASLPAPPLHDLDSIPFADYSDFPWDRYPHRIVPLVSGRGCGWNACTFCSDVTSTAGRTFRSRSPQNVLTEIKHQTQRHRAGMFVFTDLKVNSNLAVWDALLAEFQTASPGATWVAAVHVGCQGDNGLSRSHMHAARASGLVRITTGLESGSQRVLDEMAKGTDLATTSRFLHDATDAGISVRTTMIMGYPGEQADDVRQSAIFLERHRDCIERVSLNRFLIMSGTRIHHRLEKSPQAFPELTQITVNHRLAQVQHHYAPAESREYRVAVTQLLGAVHVINRRPLRPSARAFEGVM